MAGKAKPKSKIAKEQCEEKDQLMLIAARRYQEELAKPDPKDRKSSRAICNMVSDEHAKKTGRMVPLCYVTCIRRANGVKARSSSNREKGWLLQEEREQAVEFLRQMADRAMPYTLETLRELANMLIRARLGNSFPGVGENWPDRFLVAHSDQIKTYNSSPLEKARTEGANPYTHRLFFEIIKDLQVKHKIPNHSTYAADETGFMPGRACTSKVIGGVGKKQQHQKESGNRSIISVMPTICADGTSIPPLVIFSGTAYAVNWLQDNPLKAS